MARNDNTRYNRPKAKKTKKVTKSNEKEKQ